MSEIFEPIASEQPDAESLTHRRILIVMAMIAISGSLLGVVRVSGQFGVGFFIGGILSFVNYYWLKFSLKKIFDQTAEGEKPRLLGLRYLFRYVVLGTILTIVFLTKIVPLEAVILGLTSFALAIVVEGIIRIIASFSEQKEV